MATTAFYLSKMADVAGDAATAADMRSKHAALVSFLTSRHWNPTQKFFENRNADGTFITNQDSPQGLWTLIGRVATIQQVTDMTAQIRDTGKFARYHPVPSVSAASPYFYAGCKWYGPTWPPDVIMAQKGLAAQSQVSEAARAAYDIALQDVIASVATYQSNGGHLCESYQADRAGCYGGQDLTWSSAGYVISLMDTVLGLQPDAPNRALTMNVNLVEPYTVTNARIGNAVVTVGSSRRADALDGARLTVTSTSPLTVTVNVAGLQCVRALTAGTSTIDCGAFRGG